MAHELTHVVQQSTRLQRQSTSIGQEIKVGVENDELEHEATNVSRTISQDESNPVLRRATSARLQRIPAIEGLDEAGPKAEITGGEKEDRFRECAKRPDPTECEPTGALSWANFAGTPPVGGPHDAWTVAPADTVEAPVIQVCLRTVYGRTTAPITLKFQATVDSAKSWVKPGSKNPTDPAQNGCAQKIATCEAFFDREAAAGRTGGSWAVSTAPGAGCAAGIIPRGDRAASKGECATKVSADCNDREVAESARLLSHEQGHFDISCVFAKKANVALAAGRDLATIRKAVDAKLQPTQNAYDNDTSHGCKAAEQATWKRNIADGLKTITIP